MRSILFLTALAAIAADGPYRIVRKIPVPGGATWGRLTVDEGARRLYVSHGDRVEVLDLQSHSLVGAIPDTPGVNGIAIASKYGKGITANGGASNSVTVFDLKTLRKLSQFQAGFTPVAIVYDPSTTRVFVNNGGSHDVTAVDAEKNLVAGTIPLDGRPAASAADGAGKIYINLEDRNILQKIDARRMHTEARWPLAPCETPTSIAIDPESHRLFLGCRNRLLAVVDAETGRVIGTEPTGDRAEDAAFDPATKRIFVSNGDGTLNIFQEESPDKITPVQTVTTQPGARTLALDPKTHTIYLPSPAGILMVGRASAAPTTLSKPP